MLFEKGPVTSKLTHSPGIVITRIDLGGLGACFIFASIQQWTRRLRMNAAGRNSRCTRVQGPAGATRRGCRVRPPTWRRVA